MFKVFNCGCCPTVINLLCCCNSEHNFQLDPLHSAFMFILVILILTKTVVVNKGVSLWNSLPIANRKYSSINVLKKVIRNNTLSSYN